MATMIANGRSTSVLTTNKHLLRWVEKTAELTQPSDIHWVDGSDEENVVLCRKLVEAGTFTKLNERLWPGCYYARSSPNDVARVEDRTFICSLSKDNAGPTNNWEDPFVMRKRLKGLFRGSMRGRTMYVLPFSMGPVGSPMSQIGVQLTDSAYAVVNMRIMARIGSRVFAEIDKGVSRVVPCLHTVGAPLEPGDADEPLAAERREVYCPLPRDTRDLELRIGLWGQCFARKEVFCAAHRLEHRTRRGMDGGTYADRWGRVSGGREDLCHGRLSFGVRQDEFRNDDSTEEFGRLEDMDGGR